MPKSSLNEGGERVNNKLALFFCTRCHFVLALPTFLGPICWHAAKVAPLFKEMKMTTLPCKAAATRSSFDDRSISNKGSCTMLTFTLNIKQMDELLLAVIQAEFNGMTKTSLHENNTQEYYDDEKIYLLLENVSAKINELVPDFPCIDLSAVFSVVDYMRLGNPFSYVLDAADMRCNMDGAQMDALLLMAYKAEYLYIPAVIKNPFEFDGQKFSGPCRRYSLLHYWTEQRVKNIIPNFPRFCKNTALDFEKHLPPKREPFSYFRK